MGRAVQALASDEVPTRSDLWKIFAELQAASLEPVETAHEHQSVSSNAAAKVDEGGGLGADPNEATR